MSAQHSPSCGHGVAGYHYDSNGGGAGSDDDGYADDDTGTDYDDAAD